MKLLYQTTDGLLIARHKYGLCGVTGWKEPFVTDEWDTPGAHTTLGVSSDALRISLDATGNNPGFMRCNEVASQSESFINARMIKVVGNPRMGVTSHIGDILTSNADGVMLSVPIAFSASALLYEYNDAANTTLDSLAGQNGSASAHSFWLHSNAKTIAGKDDVTSRNWAGTCGTRATGQVGVWLSTPSTGIDIYTFIASTGRYVTVTGLTTGDTVQIRDSAASVLATASESGGSASVDMMGVEALNAACVVVVRSAADYAKFEVSKSVYIVGGNSYALDETVDVLAGAQSRGDYPLARRFVDSGDNVYFGGVSSFGAVYVAQLNKSSGAISSYTLGTLASGDSHGSPAILVDSSGYIWAFYSNHGIDHNCYYRKSSNPEDITAWGAVQTLTYSDDVSYPMVFENADGRIVLFLRFTDVGNYRKWFVDYTDDGSTWAGSHYWTDGQIRTYIAPRQHTDKDLLSCLLFGHFISGAFHSLYICRINLDTGDITVPGDPTVLANIYTGTTRLDPTDALEVYASTASSYAIGDDVNESGEVIFTVEDPADPANTGAYKYVTVANDGTVGTVRSVTDAGTPIINNASTLTYGGQTLGASAGLVYLAREDSGAWLIEAWKTSNSGVSWTSEQLDADPDDDVENRSAPIVPVADDPDNPTLIYNRVKAVDAATWLMACDLVVVDGVVVEVNPGARKGDMMPFFGF